MTNVVKTTKEDVLRLYDECMEFLKTNFPKYYDVVKEYKFVFGNRKRAYGVCNYRTKTISLNMYLIAHVDNWKAKDTILHEMAHAIDKGVNGFPSRHGFPWKKICIQIGAEPTSSSSEGNDIIKKSKYTMVFVKDDGTYEYVAPFHRLTKTKPLNMFLKNAYIRGRKSETMNKLKLVTFEDFVDNYEDDDQNQ